MVFLFSLWVRINVASKERLLSGDEGPWLRLSATAWTSQFMQSNVVEHDLYGMRVLPHPEDNRSPLYPLLIGALRPLGVELVALAKVFNLLVYALLFGVCVYAARRLSGDLGALFAAGFLGVSPLFIKFSAHIYPDLLVALLFFAGCALAPRFVQSVKGCAIAGLLAAAMVLTKTTGVFYLPVFFVCLYLYSGKKQRLLKIAVFGLVCLTLCLPWFVRNMRDWGSPLYQVSKHLLYLDSFQDMLEIAPPAPSWKAAIARNGLWGATGGRLLSGLWGMSQRFAVYDHGLSAALLPFALAGIALRIRSHRLWLPFVVLSVPYLLFMGLINPVVWVHRFTMLYYVLLYLLAGVGIGALYELVGKRSRPAALALLAVAALPLLCVVYPLEFYLSERGSSAQRDTALRSLLPELDTRLADTSVLYSPTLGQYAFAHRFGVINRLPYRTTRDLCELLGDYRVTHVFADTTRDPVSLSDLRSCGDSTLLFLEQFGPFSLFSFSAEH